MSLLPKLIIIATLFYVEVNTFFTNKSYNLSDGWSNVRHIYMSVPIVVKSNDSLVHVLDSMYPKHVVRFESTDFTSCEISLNLTHPSRYPRHAASLGNGKIVVWLLNYRLTPYKHMGQWKFLVVEPRDCTYSGFEIEDSDPFPIDVVDVIGYEDNFDVLITSLLDDEPRYTYVYRYNDEGSPVSSFNVSTIPDFDSHPFYRPNTICVHTAQEYDSNAGYFYMQIKPTTHITIVKRLDAKFEITSATKIKYPRHQNYNLNAYSTSHGNFSVCRYYEKKQRLRCLILDTKLKQKVDVTLNYANCKSDRFEKLIHVNLMNIRGGGTIVAFALGINYRIGTPIYLQRIWSNEKSSEPILFGKIYCEIYKLYIFEMSRNEYCVSVTCDEMVHTRCVDIK